MVSSNASQNLVAFLTQLTNQPAVMIHVDSTQGSAPREAGTWMAVFADALVGTIGGGHLEFEAIAKARRLLQTADDGQASGSADELMRFALGPTLGQCCGGVVHLRLERVSALQAPALRARLQQELQRTLSPIALFGGGHVGHALMRVLSNLPFALTWVDSRDGVFPASLPGNVVCEHSEPVQSAVPELAPQSRVLIMSFSHAEDLDVVAACLERQRKHADLPYIGLIGSQTKWATFKHRLEARGFTPAELAHVTSPIGLAGIAGKEPEVIAIAVAAQLLQILRPL